jgi:hypothetical protein
MYVPSYWFRIKETGKCHKVYEPHPNGVQLILEFDPIHAYTMDELEPITEEMYNDWMSRKKTRTKGESWMWKFNPPEGSCHEYFVRDVNELKDAIEIFDKWQKSEYEPEAQWPSEVVRDTENWCFADWVHVVNGGQL